MTPDSDILIVGGGLNGPALALALAQSGLSVTVVDALARDTRADPGFDGRSYALSAGSVRLLRALGIWSQVAGQAQPMHRIVVSDGRAVGNVHARACRWSRASRTWPKVLSVAAGLP